MGWTEVFDTAILPLGGTGSRRPAVPQQPRIWSCPPNAGPWPLQALACSAGAHLDAARRLPWCARQPQREHALFQVGLNSGGVDLLRQLELPEEAR